MKGLLSAIANIVVLGACSQLEGPDHRVMVDAGTSAGRRDGGAAQDAAAHLSTDSAMNGPHVSHPAEDDTNSGSEKSGTAELCDGTNAVRLLYEIYGGFGMPTDQFTSANGSTFFFVDGKCHFYVSDASVHGVRTGSLSRADAAQLSADLAWSKLDEWSDYGTRSDQACPDAPVTQLVKQNVALGCICGCDPQAPAGLADAQRNASGWVMELWRRGSELTTAVSAMAIPGDRNNTQYMPWPLGRSMSSIANLVVTPEAVQSFEGPYARFDNATEATALRKLRADAFANDKQHALVIPVSETGMKYDLFVRDELPDELAQELSKLRESLPNATSP